MPVANAEVVQFTRLDLAARWNMRGSSSLHYHRLGFLKALGKTAMTSDGVLGEVHVRPSADRGATAGTGLSRDNARHHVHCSHHVVTLLSLSIAYEFDYGQHRGYKTLSSSN